MYLISSIPYTFHHTIGRTVQREILKADVLENFNNSSTSSISNLPYHHIVFYHVVAPDTTPVSIHICCGVQSSSLCTAPYILYCSRASIFSFLSSILLLLFSQKPLVLVHFILGLSLILVLFLFFITLKKCSTHLEFLEHLFTAYFMYPPYSLSLQHLYLSPHCLSPWH